MARMSYPVRAMISWLKDKDPDVWFAITPMLNWDNAVPVLKWIVSQPHCDRANAAMIFWFAGPGFHAVELAKGEQPQFESWTLIETILRNWKAGLYQRSELAWPDKDGQASLASYERDVSGTPGARQALDIPPDLFGPFRGRRPKVPTSLMPEENQELWDLLNRLGCQARFRPGSELWLAQREGRWKPYQPPRRSLFGEPNWSPAAIFWLGLSFLLLMLFVFLRFS
jgi:hypothetical protein